MLVSLFDYDLPPDRIALSPASPRELAKLLIVGADGALADRTVGDLPSLLRPGDALVVNDTRVIAARLRGVRARGETTAGVEVTLMRRLDGSRWLALARPAKKLKVGERIRFDDPRESSAGLLASLDADVEAKGEAGDVTLSFSLSGPALDEAVDRLGEIPLPPYIASKRAPGDTDRRDYQTVFAAEPGAVAAPTAGLHFTPDLLRRAEVAGATVHRVTLHVGGGTFLPVKAEDTDAHAMHSEWFRIDEATAAALNATRASGGRIIAVGTTSLRALESAASEDGVIRPFHGDTSIFITPGYRFRAVDVLMTNFHLPRSTLLMLVSAFSGLETIRRAYAHAISGDFRFFSYGDACWLERAR